MDYRQLAKDLLKRKKQLEAAVKSLELQREQLDAALTDCKSPTYDGMPHTRAYGDGQDRLAAITDRIAECAHRTKVVERELQMIEIGMSVLSDYQKVVLTEFFINDRKGVAEDLCDKYYRERSCLYTDRKKALDMFTIAVFGMLES